MKKTAALIILSVLCILNIGVAFAGNDSEPISMPVLYEENAAIPTLYTEEVPLPVLYGEEAPIPVLISEKPEFKWNSQGKSGVMESSPIIKDGTMYFPLREIAESTDFTITWNGSDRSVEMVKEDFSSKMYIDNTNYKSGETSGKFDSNPMLIEGRTFLSESDMEAILGLFVTTQDTDLFFNPNDIEIIAGNVESTKDWFQDKKEIPGTYIKTVDGSSYVLIVEEERNTGGYTFDFSNIELTDGILRVEYDLNPPIDMATQALTKPSALIKVSNEISEVKVDNYNYSGTISDLKFEESGATLYLEGGNLEERTDDLVVRVGIDTIIEDGISQDFKIGTLLDVQYSISTRGIPAQTNAEKIRVIETPEIFSTYEGKVKEITESDKGYSIRLSKDGNIINDLIIHIQKGSYMESEMYELEGKTVTVEYTIMTMSIPAQTSPIKIQVER